MLEAKFRLSGLVLAALERFLAASRTAAQPREPPSPSVAASEGHKDAVMRFALFLQVGASPQWHCISGQAVLHLLLVDGLARFVKFSTCQAQISHMCRSPQRGVPSQCPGTMCSGSGPH
jgi:hypothetical protein